MEQGDRIQEVSFAWPPKPVESSALGAQVDDLLTTEPTSTNAQVATVPLDEGRPEPTSAQTLAVALDELDGTVDLESASKLYLSQDMVHDTPPQGPVDAAGSVPVSETTSVAVANPEPAPTTPPPAQQGADEPDAGQGADATEASHTPLANSLTWSADAGTTLYELLSDWASREEWMVSWETDIHYRIEVPFSIDAPDFLSAAGNLLQAYIDAGQSLVPVAHPNKVLVIKTP